MKDKLIIAIYLRTRHTGADYCNTLAQQHESCLAWARSHDLRDRVACVYTDPPGTSANDPVESRPGLEQLLDDIHSGQVDALVIFDSHIISRNVSRASEIAGFLQQHNVTLISGSERVLPVQQKNRSPSPEFAFVELEGLS